MKKQKNLTSEETLEKFKEYGKTRDPKLREELITRNMGLVNYISYPLSKITKINIHELESYGNEGLINAVDKFNIEMGNQFSTYACQVIRGTILSGLAEINGYKIGEFYSDFSSAKRIIEEKFEITMEEDNSLVDKIIDLLVTTGKISEENRENNKTRIMLHNTESLEPYLDKQEFCLDKEEKYLENDYDNEFLAEDNRLYLELTSIFAREKLKESLESLYENEQAIIEGYFGLDQEEKNLAALGIIHNRSGEQIRKTKDRAIRKLKHPTRTEQLKDFYQAFVEYNYEPNPIKETPTALQKKRYWK